MYSIQQLSDSVKASAAFIVAIGGELSWGTKLGISTLSLFLLIGVAGLEIF